MNNNGLVVYTHSLSLYGLRQMQYSSSSVDSLAFLQSSHTNESIFLARRSPIPTQLP